MDGQELTGFRSDKARALLVYLLLAGERPIPRTVLQELFWEGYEAQSARASLRSTLANLAKLLKPLNLLHITRKIVQFEQSREQAGRPVWCDVWQFDTLVQQKALDRERLQQASPKSTLPSSGHALARILYPTGRLRTVGDFLAGFNFTDSPQIAQWVNNFAQKYRMQLLALFPHNLPRQGTPFIGRREEADAIMRKVLAPDYPFITLMGTGGVGKTRLALRVGEQARGH